MLFVAQHPEKKRLEFHELPHAIQTANHTSAQYARRDRSSQEPRARYPMAGDLMLPLP